MKHESIEPMWFILIATAIEIATRSKSVFVAECPQSKFGFGPSDSRIAQQIQLVASNINGRQEEIEGDREAGTPEEKQQVAIERS